jgi:hypothetical protein
MDARRHPFLWGPAVLLSLSVLLALGLLLTNHDDPSYSCRHVAVVDVINPEPESTAAFPGDAFDSGHACNRDARLHAGAAGVLVVLGGFVTSYWVRRRNRSQP